MPSHGLFLFARLARKAGTEKDEERFYHELAVRGVVVARGTPFKGVDKDFGWARLRFSIPVAQMEDAVRKIELFLEKRE